MQAATERRTNRARRHDVEHGGYGDEEQGRVRKERILNLPRPVRGNHDAKDQRADDGDDSRGTPIEGSERI